MKRFHDVAGGPETQSEEERNAIRELRSLLVFGKVENSILKDLFSIILAKEMNSSEADGELPQALIHFEVALMQLEADKAGLGEIAKRSDGRFLSALSNERIGELFKGHRSFTDNLETVKSALIWEGGRQHGK